MILGRSTVQWTALITAAAALVQVLVVTLIPGVDAVIVATIIGAVTGFLAVFIAFLANTATTPIKDARLESGTPVALIDNQGHLTGDKVIVRKTPPGPIGVDGDGEGP